MQHWGHADCVYIKALKYTMRYIIAWIFFLLCRDNNFPSASALVHYSTHFSLFLPHRAFIDKVLIQLINVPDAGEIISIKCMKIVLVKNPCVSKVPWWQDFISEIIDFWGGSMARGPVSPRGALRVKLSTVPSDLLNALRVCAVIKKKYCFIKPQCAAAMTPANAVCCCGLSLGNGTGFSFVFSL